MTSHKNDPSQIIPITKWCNHCSAEFKVHRSSHRTKCDACRELFLTTTPAKRSFADSKSKLSPDELARVYADIAMLKERLAAKLAQETEEEKRVWAEKFAAYAALKKADDRRRIPHSAASLALQAESARDNKAIRRYLDGCMRPGDAERLGLVEEE